MSDTTHWDYFLSKLPGYEETGDDDNAVLAPCPCPSHGIDGLDSNPSLRAFLSEDGVVVLVCRAGCRTGQVLKAMELTFGQLYPQDARHLAEADMDLRAAVYGQVLDFLPLHGKHEKSLLTRGFTREEIQKNQYRTMDRSLRDALDIHLGRHFSREDLGHVPGFDEAGRLRVSDMLCGLVMPLRRTTGEPYLLKVRRTSKPKYVLWTSEHLASEPGYHWPLANKELPGGRLILAEGEFKADLVAARMGVRALSFPGVEHAKGAIDFVGEEVTGCLDAENGMALAWDWGDVVAKKNMARALLLNLDQLSRKGYSPGVLTWEVDKGVDDALAAGREVLCLPASEARARLVALLGDQTSSVTPLKEDPFLPISQLVPPPFPIDVFPEGGLRDWLTQGAALTNTPPDYIACSALVVAGRALGTRVKISLLPGWEEQANIYMALVAPPGSTKSPALDKAMGPLKEMQHAVYEAFKVRRQAYEQLLEYTTTQKKGKKPDPPLPPHEYFVDDFTWESLGQDLLRNGLSHEIKDAAILVFRDEISAWVKSMNQYKAKGEGPDKENFLKAWGGDDIKVNRKSMEDGALYIRKPFVSVLGSTTPDVVCDLDGKNSRMDGFFQRILFCAAPPKAAFRLEDVMPDYPARHVWKVVLSRLFSWRKTIVLKPTPQAWDYLKDHYDSQADIADGGLNSDLAAMISKHRAYVQRLALVIHAMRVAVGQSQTGKLAEALYEQPNLRQITDFGMVEVEDIEAARRLVSYFQAHYVYVRRVMQQGPEERRIDEFAAWAGQQPGGRIEAADLYKDKRFGCKGRQDALKLFKAAEDRGHGACLESKGGGGDTTFFAR